MFATDDVCGSTPVLLRKNAELLCCTIDDLIKNCTLRAFCRYKTVLEPFAGTEFWHRETGWAPLARVLVSTQKQRTILLFPEHILSKDESSLPLPPITYSPGVTVGDSDRGWLYGLLTTNSDEGCGFVRIWLQPPDDDDNTPNIAFASRVAAVATALLPQSQVDIRTISRQGRGEPRTAILINFTDSPASEEARVIGRMRAILAERKTRPNKRICQGRVPPFILNGTLDMQTGYMAGICETNKDKFKHFSSENMLAALELTYLCDLVYGRNSTRVTTLPLQPITLEGVRFRITINPNRKNSLRVFRIPPSEKDGFVTLLDDEDVTQSIFDHADSDTSVGSGSSEDEEENEEEEDEEYESGGFTSDNSKSDDKPSGKRARSAEPRLG